MKRLCLVVLMIAVGLSASADEQPTAEEILERLIEIEQLSTETERLVALSEYTVELKEALRRSDASPTVAGRPERADFAEAWWGMTRAEVRKTLTGRPVEDMPDRLTVVTSVASLNAYAVYTFLDDALFVGGYVFSEFYFDGDAYIDDFERLKDLLTDIYGEPSVDEATWSRDDHVPRSSWGHEFNMGRVEFYAMWMTDRTVIELSLSRQDSDVTHMLRYVDRRHQSDFEDMQKRGL